MMTTIGMTVDSYTVRINIMLLSEIARCSDDVLNVARAAATIALRLPKIEAIASTTSEVYRKDRVPL